MDALKKSASKLTDGLDSFKPLLLVAKQLNIPTSALVIPGFILALVCVFSGIFSNTLVTVLGFCYPAYMSFKALESKCDPEDVGRESKEAEACDDDR